MYHGRAYVESVRRGCGQGGETQYEGRLTITQDWYTFSDLPGGGGM